MELFTKIDIPQADFRIDYKSNLVFIGSCFAENISRRFADRKFHVLANPLGVVYNPLSIENQIAKIAGSPEFGDGCADNWSRWDYQGSYPSEELRQVIKNTRDSLAKADVVFITLGTAFVYFLKETGKAVANCHKEPANLFERRLITVEEATEALRNICHWILRSAQNDERVAQKDVKIVFTVSPLRHLNDGAHGNNLSKATLHLAIEKVLQEFADTAGANSPAVSYFPSYEIVMDELRDYRFYAEDMSHLTATAEEYIFERMRDTYCNEKTIADMKRVEKFMKTANHKIVDPNSPKAEELKQLIAEKAEQLEKLIPGLILR